MAELQVPNGRPDLLTSCPWLPHTFASPIASKWWSGCWLEPPHWRVTTNEPWRWILMVPQTAPRFSHKWLWFNCIFSHFRCWLFGDMETLKDPMKQIFDTLLASLACTQSARLFTQRRIITSNQKDNQKNKMITYDNVESFRKKTFRSTKNLPDQNQGTTVTMLAHHPGVDTSKALLRDEPSSTAYNVGTSVVISVKVITFTVVLSTFLA